SKGAGHFSEEWPASVCLASIFLLALLALAAVFFSQRDPSVRLRFQQELVVSSAQPALLPENNIRTGSDDSLVHSHTGAAWREGSSAFFAKVDWDVFQEALLF